jgi:UDP-N-acetylmuramate dehydrogenase
MNTQSNISLRPYNTFGIEVHAEAFAEVHSTDDLLRILFHNTLPVFILGGGSNLLFTQDIEGLVLKNNIKGIEIVEENSKNALIAIGGGEEWHPFVRWTIEQGLGGLENLSLIPGTVGAAPIQNIGAYGVELKDCFVHLEAVNLQTLHVEIFSHKDCAFGYRNSIFKHSAKGKYIITKVVLRLSKQPILRSDYGDLQQVLKDAGIQQPTIEDLSNAVIQIRQSKLPNPKELGNAGSFFKNPEISIAHYTTLKEKFETMPSYPISPTMVKVPAGWLIEQCGWKGKRIGNCGSHSKQALVLVNYGNATGDEIEQLAYAIIDSVEEKFAIRLSVEVNIL